jgi:hypothetical protein
MDLDSAVHPAPKPTRHVREFFQFCSKCFMWEWIQLLNTNDCNISSSAFFTSINQIVINFTGASDNAFYFLASIVSSTSPITVWNAICQIFQR